MDWNQWVIERAYISPPTRMANHQKQQSYKMGATNTVTATQASQTSFFKTGSRNIRLLSIQESQRPKPPQSPRQTPETRSRHHNFRTRSRRRRRPRTTLFHAVVVNTRRTLSPTKLRPETETERTSKHPECQTTRIP
jgi:hypothetical protein